MSTRLSIGSSRKKGSDSGSADSIKVLCRFRPPANLSVSRESGQQAPTSNIVSNPRNSLKSSPKVPISPDSFRLDPDRSEIEFISDFNEKKLFTFDKVFGAETKQVDVFHQISGVVGSVLSGFNGTVMAYGQTSAGKSWTMEGAADNASLANNDAPHPLWESENRGVIPRCVDLLFEEINNADSDIQFQITLSFFEIYCEKVRDLLNPQQCNLKVRETKGGGFAVQDVTEIFCTDRDSVLRVIELGKLNRAQAPTLMNAESSRSHSIVTLEVHQKNTKTGRLKRGVLFLVDLAGSEKVSKTGASGMRLEEAKNINSSLTTLGMVINALCDGNSHIPYRDSKLTMILMEALGGNSKTTLIICCNPEQKHSSETLSTLRFGERAKKIKNNVKVNEELSVDELKFLLAEARREIHKLKLKIKALKEGSSAAGPEDGEAEEEGDEDSELASGNKPKGSTTIRSSPPDEFAASKKLEDLLETKLQEIEILKGNMSAAEEELETIKIKYDEEREQRMQAVSEAEALQSTIEELEAKLLKSNLHSKSMHSFSRTASKSAMEAFEKWQEESRGGKSSSGCGYEETQGQNGKMPPLKENNDIVSNGTEETLKGIDDLKGDSSSSGASLNHAYGPQQDLGLNTKDIKPEKSTEIKENDLNNEIQDGVTNMISLKELETHSQTLKQTLEAEIKGLESSLSEKESDVITANKAAQMYAEKYIKLKEDYETHIQRLLFKLTQEQQARTHIEDRLEEALHRLWRQSSTASKTKSFFSSLLYSIEKALGLREKFDGSTSASTGGSLLEDTNADGGGSGSAAGRKSTRSNRYSMSFLSGHPNEHEANLSKALEVAQFRIAQLMSDLESTREAQQIVLETKESVMRSLAKQNSKLSIERDTLNKRVEELSLTVDQLTNLLKSLQSQSQHIITGNTPRNVSSNKQFSSLHRGSFFSRSDNSLPIPEEDTADDDSK